MHGLVVLDQHGEVIRPAILWNDQRTAAECAEIEERIGLERLIQLTGNRALTGFTAPKLLWLRNHEPGDVRADPPRAPAEGLRPLPPHRRARDRRRRRVRDAPLRRRQPALERRGAGRARAPARVAAARLRVDRDRRRRRPGGGCARRRDRRARAALGRPRHLRRRLRRTRRVPPGARGAAAHLLPRRSRHLARDGGDALRGRVAAMAPARARRPSYDEILAEADAGPPGTEGLLFQPYLQGERTPHADPTPAAPSSACSSATTAAPSTAPSSKASPTACATRSSCCAASASTHASAASPAAAPAASSGCGSSPPSSACRSSARRPRRAQPTAPRCSAPSRRASSPTRTRRSRPPSACATASSPTPTGRTPTRRATPATASCTRLCGGSRDRRARRVLRLRRVRAASTPLVGRKDREGVPVTEIHFDERRRRRRRGVRRRRGRQTRNRDRPRRSRARQADLPRRGGGARAARLRRPPRRHELSTRRLDPGAGRRDACSGC